MSGPNNPDDPDDKPDYSQFFQPYKRRKKKKSPDKLDHALDKYLNELYLSGNFSQYTVKPAQPDEASDKDVIRRHFSSNLSLPSRKQGFPYKFFKAGDKFYPLEANPETEKLSETGISEEELKRLIDRYFPSATKKELDRLIESLRESKHGVPEGKYHVYVVPPGQVPPVVGAGVPEDELPEGGFRSDIPTLELIQQLSNVLGENYKNIRPYRIGGTRICFLADWGPNGKGTQPRIIKIDRRDLDSPRAQRHVSRGYDTDHNLEVLASIPILEAQQNNIIGLADFNIDSDKFKILVEPFFEGDSLEETVEKEGTLGPIETKRIFSKVIQAVRYLSKRGLYHRDLKPSNILVRVIERIYDYTYEVGVTDLANAIEKDEIDPDFLPTAGGHFVMDPLLMCVFTGDSEAKYSEQSEMYEIGMSMYFALTGKYPFEFDPDEGTAIVNPNLKSEFAGQSLLDENRMLDRKMYEHVLSDALRNELPFWAKLLSYEKIIERCLTLKDSKPRISLFRGRYRSVDDLARDFDVQTKVAFPLTTATIIGYGLFKLGEAIFSMF